MEEKKLAAHLLKKYLTDKATPGEMEQVENWYNSYEHRKVLPTQEKKETARLQMLAQLQQQMNKKPEAPVFYRTSTFIRIAAAITIICSIGLIFMKGRQPKAVITQPELVFSTLPGEKKTLLLSDGSEVILSPSGRLSYPKKFSLAKREITLLEGEAFFKIAHEEKRPFTVQLPGKIYTKVLGTSFTIRARKANPELNIIVNTGKVAVGNKHQLFGTLIKGQQITYNKIRESAIISQAPLTDNKIVFDKTDLQDAIHQLEYIYTIKIELSPETLGKLGCTATFHTLQRPEQILDIICSLHNLKLQTTPDHKSFKIYRK